jgi:alkyl sulfatase BDS1-like metallo-beta-lactamase superfamily hydrolase
MDEIQAGRITLDGDPAALLTIFGNLDTFTVGFNVVEP